MIAWFLRRLAVAVPTLLVLIVVSYLLMYAAPRRAVRHRAGAPARGHGQPRAQVRPRPAPRRPDLALRGLHRHRVRFRPVVPVHRPERQRHHPAGLSGHPHLRGVVVRGRRPRRRRARHRGRRPPQLRGSTTSPSASRIGAQVLPNFVMAPILTLVFTLWLGWLPGGGWQGGEWPYVVMPVIALSTSFMASIAGSPAPPCWRC